MVARTRPCVATRRATRLGFGPPSPPPSAAAPAASPPPEPPPTPHPELLLDPGTKLVPSTIAAPLTGFKIPDLFHRPPALLRPSFSGSLDLSVAPISSSSTAFPPSSSNHKRARWCGVSVEIQPPSVGLDVVPHGGCGRPGPSLHHQHAVADTSLGSNRSPPRSGTPPNIDLDLGHTGPEQALAHPPPSTQSLESSVPPRSSSPGGFPPVEMQLNIAREVIVRLKKAREKRILAVHEQSLLKDLQARVPALELAVRKNKATLPELSPDDFPQVDSPVPQPLHVCSVTGSSHAALEPSLSRWPSSSLDPPLAVASSVAVAADTPASFVSATHLLLGAPAYHPPASSPPSIAVVLSSARRRPRCRLRLSFPAPAASEVLASQVTALRECTQAKLGRQVASRRRLGMAPLALVMDHIPLLSGVEDAEAPLMCCVVLLVC